MTPKPAAQCTECQSMKRTVGHIQHHQPAAHTSMEWPLSLSNHPVSNEEVVLQDADGMRIAIFDLESEAKYAIRAVNAYEKDQQIKEDLLLLLKNIVVGDFLYGKYLTDAKEAIANAEK